jgi:hypothetical protein
MSMMSICTQVIEQRYECDKTDLDKSMESVIATVQAENKKKKDELYLDKDLALQVRIISFDKSLISIKLEKLVKETKDQKTKRQRTMRKIFYTVVKNNQS